MTKRKGNRTVTPQRSILPVNRAHPEDVQAYLMQKGQQKAAYSTESMRQFFSLPVTLGSTAAQREEQNLAFDSMGGFATLSQSLQAHTAAMGQIPLMGFVGYGFLQQIAQNGMIRNCIKATADDITREWIELETEGDDTDKDERLSELAVLLEKKYRIRGLFNQAASMTGFMGGCFIFIDTGTEDVHIPLTVESASSEFSQGMTLRFTIVDPVNVTPSRYNSTNPLRQDFLKPEEWMVLGRPVHASRMLRIVFNEPPTLLKAAYNFLGIPQAQILWDYVAHWNACREAGLEIARKMNLLLYRTNAREKMETLDGIQALDARMEALQTFRDNNAIVVVDTEDDVQNVQMTVSGVTDITRQSAEDICAINGTPATKTLSISPAGFNATGESDLRNYYDRIRSQQELLRNAIQTVIHAVMLAEWGEIDEAITFSFKELAKQDEMLVAQQIASRIGALSTLKDRNAISADELRQAAKKMDSSGLSFISGDAPEEEDSMQTDDPLSSLMSMSAQGGQAEEGMNRGNEDQNG